MLISPKEIFPSQDYLNPDTIKYILECIKNNELNRLPPAPIVRRDFNGKLIAIDGHNLIAVRLALKQNVDVHLAKSKLDGLLVETAADRKRNQELFEKFDKVIGWRDELSKLGINNFADLVGEYDLILKAIC